MIRDTDDDPKTCKTCAETGRECHWTRAANVPHSEVNAAASTQRTSEMRDIEMVDVESIPSQSSRKRKRAPEGKGKGKSKARRQSSEDESDESEEDEAPFAGEPDTSGEDIESTPAPGPSRSGPRPRPIRRPPIAANASPSAAKDPLSDVADLVVGLGESDGCARAVMMLPSSLTMISSLISILPILYDR